MSTQTTNLGLTLPAGTEHVSRTVINTNMSTIDDAIGPLASGKTVQGQISDIIDDIGSTALPTTAQTITGAIAEHETDIGGKADKVSGGTSGDFAGIDSNGNLTDSGKKASDFIAASEKGANSGVAELDSSGKVPSSQLPSYVDDVVEAASQSDFPATGETGKIYVALDTNLTYRWSGSAYVEISASIALGETDSTAYRGDRGASAYAHAVTNKGAAFSSGLYKITTNGEGHVTGATAVEKADITALGIPGDIPDGSTSQKGIVQLEDSHASTSTNKAATPKNVKEAYDLADGKADKAQAINITALAAGWSNTTTPTQTIAVTDMTTTTKFMIGAGSLTITQLDDMAAAKIRCTSQGTGSITLSCYGDLPSNDLPMVVMILG